MKKESPTNEDASQLWFFTFGLSSKNRDKFIVIHGTREGARLEMVKKFGLKWAFQYSEEKWHDENGVPQHIKYGLTQLR